MTEVCVRFDGNERKVLEVTADASVDLATATAVLAIGEVEFPLTWSATATHTGDRWTRPAFTGYFAGPDVPVGSIAGAPILARGIHRTELRVTIGSSIIASKIESIQVV